jgi:hypothetical protein
MRMQKRNGISVGGCAGRINLNLDLLLCIENLYLRTTDVIVKAESFLCSVSSALVLVACRVRTRFIRDVTRRNGGFQEFETF